MDLNLEKIVDLIKRGVNTNAGLCGAFGLSYSRDMDQALQKLRRNGVIRYDGGKWFSTHEKPCEACGGRGKVPA